MDKVECKAGSILLTAGVGGTAAKWRDRALSSSIIRCQRAKMTGFEPRRSHAELLTGSRGETFAARWRTRERDNGLSDYIGSQITIASLVPALTRLEYREAWALSGMSGLDGHVYPVHRILLLALTSSVLPGWLDEINLNGDWAMCSELVARFYTAVRRIRLPRFGKDYLRFVEGGWKGIMPGHIEQAINGYEFEITFTGILTDEIMDASGLPTFKQQA